MLGIRGLPQRWQAVLVVVLALTACGGGTSDPVAGDPFEFDRRDDPGVVVAPLDWDTLLGPPTHGDG